MHPLRCVGIFSSSQRAFALIDRAVAHGIERYVDAAEQREKGMVCFIERKDKLFVSNCLVFLRENILIFRFCERKTKNTGTFFRSSPCFSHRSPSFSGRLPARGRNRWLISRSFGVLSVSRPSGWCALAHDALARGDAHPRLAHSASFHFFAFTHHLQPAELLLVRCEGFCISMICPGG